MEEAITVMGIIGLDYLSTIAVHMQDANTCIYFCYMKVFAKNIICYLDFPAAAIS